MSDPATQDHLDIPDRETAIKRLDALQRNVLRLRDDLPGMRTTTKRIRQHLEGLSRDLNRAIDLTEQLMAIQQTWMDWLAGRLTLLAHLRLYLTQANQENGRDLEEDGG